MQATNIITCLRLIHIYIRLTDVCFTHSFSRSHMSYFTICIVIYTRFNVFRVFQIIFLLYN